MKFSSLQKIPKLAWISAFSFIILGGFYAGSFGIIQHQFAKNQASPEVSLENFEIIHVAKDNLTVDVNFTIDYPLSTQEIRFNLLEMEILFNDTLVATVDSNPSQFRSNMTSFRVNLTFTIITPQIYSWIIRKITQNETVSLQLQGKLKIKGFLAIFPKFEINQDINITNSENLQISEYFNMTISNVYLDTENASYTIEGSLEILNPFNFPINITKIEGDISFNDPDGYVLIFNFNPANDIELANIDLDWSDSPLQLPANSTGSKNFTIENDAISALAIPRLLDEINQERLYLNVYDAKIVIQIAGSDWEILFSLEDIYIKL